MKKSLLLKYLANQASKQEQQQVLDWAEKSESNMNYLISLKLNYVSATLPNTSASEEEMQAMRSSILNLEQPKAASTLKNKRSANNKYRIITILSSAVAVIAIIAFILKPSINNPVVLEQMHQRVLAELKKQEIRIGLKDIPSEQIQTIYTEKGVKSTIILPDKSIVQLNSDTKISFPTKFIGSTREVNLSGEAYFKVTSDSIKPMIVTTNKGFMVKVLGTEFNIKSYDNDNQAQTTLYKGAIDLITASSTTSVKPNQQILINSQNKVKLINPSAVEDTKAWTEGKLIFDETPISEVIKMLERWHGVQFNVKENKILDYKITANFNSESIYQIMYIIKNCTLVDYTIEDNLVSVFSR